MLLQVQKIVRKKFSILRRVSSVTLTQASNKPPRLHASITKIARQQANKFFRRFDLHTADKLVTISRHDTLTLKNYSNEGTPVATHRRSWNLLIPFRLSLFLIPLGGAAGIAATTWWEWIVTRGTLNLDTWPVVTRQFNPRTVVVDPTCDTRAHTFVSFPTFPVNAAWLMVYVNTTQTVKIGNLFRPLWHSQELSSWLNLLHTIGESNFHTVDISYWNYYDLLILRWW